MRRVAWVAAVGACAILIGLLFTGCGGGAAIKPEEVVQTRTVTADVKIPAPIPCANRSDIPILPPATEINIATAKPSQKAAATAVDAEQYERYARQSYLLLERCVREGK
jgi:hypothetical protein